MSGAEGDAWVSKEEETGRFRWSRGSVLAFSTRRIFKGEKILSTSSFGGEVKPSVPCRRFTACKRTLECIVEVGISRQNHRSSFSPTNISTFRCLELSRRVRRAETSGGKSGKSYNTIWAGTISHQAAVHPKYKLGALYMKEEEGGAKNQIMRGSMI
jgi:hypothetical protein